MDKKTFSANDLKDFTSLTEQQSDSTKVKMDKAENARKGKMGEKGEEGHKKSMAEELYDGSANKAVDVKSA